jgi:hypothetical protein
MVNLGKFDPQNYQTTCYYRQGNELLSPESCVVTLEFDHPEHGLTWKIVTRSGQTHHYRNQGTGVELWSHLAQQWLKVNHVDWFPGQEKVLCWDNFCAEWEALPLD